MAAINQGPSSTSRRPSRFDLAVWMLMALLTFLTALLVWWNGRQSLPVSSNLEPAILFSTSDENGVEQLFSLPVELDGGDSVPLFGEIRQLTGQSGTVWDYAVRPGGEMVVYSELTDEMGTNLWQFQASGDGPSVLMACSPSACDGPSWSADGAFVGFSQRRGTEESGSLLNPPRPWMMNFESGETAAILPDDQELGFDLRWAPDDQWVAYVSPVEGQIGLVNLVDGSRRFLESGTGEAAVWRPEQPSFLFTRMIQVGNAYASHVILAQADAEETTDISGIDNLFEDRNPAWSPDGELIALRRKVVEGENATRGSQIWLMRSDGSDARALTNDPEADFGEPHWSPDGRFLVYQKTPLKDPDLKLSVWLLNVESGESWQAVESGQRPAWFSVTR